MKGKFVGYLISALFVVVVVYVAFRITTVRNFILGTTTATS